MSRSSVLVVVTALCIGPTTVHALPDIYGFGFSMTVSPIQVLPGDTITVSWRVSNNSTVGIPELPPPPEQFTTAYGPWDDAVLLGTTLLGTRTFTGALPPAGSYLATKDFVVPAGLSPGNYFPRVRADYYNVLTEVDETNNSWLYNHAITVLPEPVTSFLLVAGMFLIQRRRPAV